MSFRTDCKFARANVINENHSKKIKNMKKKIIVLSSVLLLSVGWANVKSQVNNLVIRYTNGNEKIIRLSNVKNVTFSLETANINLFAGENEVAEKADVQKLYFENTNAIPKVVAGQNNIVLYPNPTKGLLNFRNLPNRAVNIRISNLSGVQLFVGIIAASVQSLDVSFLAQGIYFVNINNQLVKLIKL
jgi:hypothetical protein